MFLDGVLLDWDSSDLWWRAISMPAAKVWQLPASTTPAITYGDIYGLEGLLMAVLLPIVPDWHPAVDYLQRSLHRQTACHRSQRWCIAGYCVAALRLTRKQSPSVF